MLPIIAVVSALAQFAPQITKWMDAGKSVQEVAETAFNIAKQVTGAKSDEEAIELIKADPNLHLDFQKKIIDQDIVYEQGYIQDKADARKYAAIMSATPHGNVRANWLVGIAVITIFACLGVIIWADLNEFAQSAVMIILGMYVKELSNIYAFEFGTTRRSRQKSDAAELGKSE